MRSEKCPTQRRQRSAVTWRLRRSVISHITGRIPRSSPEAFGNDPKRVAKMGAAYLNGAHENEGFACAAKHFPGNGQDLRDAHLSNNVNYFDVDEWDATYGMVYKTLIDNGLDVDDGRTYHDAEVCESDQPGAERRGYDAGDTFPGDHDDAASRPSRI